jgi:L-ascorbate metabolism protein UlaG (beta-lactamase superfamily)
VQLAFYGNACWAILSSLRIVLDPGGLFAIPKVGSAQVVCITHADPDHINGLASVAPEAPRVLMAPKPLDSRFSFEGATYSQAGWTITPIPVKHRLRPWVNHRGYLLCGEGLRILHMGDGNQLTQDVGPIDVLMVTVGGMGANPWEGAKLAKRLKPRWVFPMHAMFKWQLDTFKRLVPEADILKPGETREITNKTK